MLTADEVIKLLDLAPLPWEGGWFRETYRAEGRVRVEGLLAEFGSGIGLPRNFSTQIYFLLREGQVSVLHAVRQDEVFHHYLGDPVEQLRIPRDGPAEVVRIGPDLAAGDRPQALVPGGVWQGARLARPAEGFGVHGFALLGCTVSPGFDWEDFSLPEPDQLKAFASRHPEHEGLIRTLSPKPRA